MSAKESNPRPHQPNPESPSHASSTQLAPHEPKPRLISPTHPLSAATCAGARARRAASPDDPEYRIVFKFRDRETLTTWEESEERAELLEQIESLLVQPSEREVTSGIVTWFTLPGQNPVQPPPKWKMTIVSWLALYPAVTLVFVIFGDLLAQVPLLLRTMIVTIVVMGLMSYVLMPRMTKWFKFWLFPDRPRNSR